MSRQGFLSDEELRECFTDYYGFKLDKEAFNRPDNLLEIYSRFLIDIFPGWRASEEIAKMLLVSNVRKAIAHLQPDYIFNIHDLTKPNRKRTNYFLNSLVFAKLRLDSAARSFETLENKRLEQQMEIENLAKENATMILQTEERKIEKMNSRDLEKDLEILNSEFARLKEQSDLAGERPTIFKQKINELTALDQKRAIELEERDRQIARLEQTEIKFLKDGSKSASDIPSLQHGLKLERDRSRLAFNDESAKEGILKKLQNHIQIMKRCVGSDFKQKMKQLEKKPIHASAIHKKELNQLKDQLGKCQTEEKVSEHQIIILKQEKTKKQVQLNAKNEQACIDLERGKSAEHDLVNQHCQQVSQIKSEIAEIDKKLSMLRARESEKQDFYQNQASRVLALTDTLFTTIDQQRKDMEPNIKSSTEYRRLLQL